jgi:hypothetical protein
MNLFQAINNAMSIVLNTDPTAGYCQLLYYSQIALDIRVHFTDSRFWRGCCLWWSLPLHD